MSPPSHAAYSGEVKALPSSYHSGSAQTTEFNKTADTRGNGDHEACQRLFLTDSSAVLSGVFT